MQHPVWTLVVIGLVIAAVGAVWLLAPHTHSGYDEVYYVLLGTGTIKLDQETQPLRQRSVAIVPAGVTHSLEANNGKELEFIIFGTLAMAMDDDRAKPKKVDIPAHPDGESK